MTTLERMTTLDDMARTPGACYVYYGDRGDWPVAYAVHRDSELIERCNFEVMRAAFAECGEENEDWTIESSSHWLVGYVDYLLIRPGSELVAMADDMRARINDYPILDDDKYSEMEWEEHDKEICEQWCSICESDKQEHEYGDCREECRVCKEEREAAHYADECDDDCALCAEVARESATV